MKILFSPQIPVNGTDKILYEFSTDWIKVTYPNGDSDVFDFKGVPDGELEVTDTETGESLIETILDPNPLLSAKRVGGVLSVELLSWIGLDATKEERFPDWIDHEDYAPPESEEESEEELEESEESEEDGEDGEDGGEADELMAQIKWKSKYEIFEEQKDNKKQLLSRDCHDEIVKGFFHSVNGRQYFFSYDMEAQTNFQEAYQLFQNKVIDEIRWNAKLKGESVRLSFSKTQFESLFYAGVKHKQVLISKLKDDIEPLVESADTREELENISWSSKDPKEKSFRLTNTMDRELNNLSMRTEMSDMALMEIANMVMGME